MKLYLIYACEGRFRGYHGIYDVDVIPCISYEEAIGIGEDMSIDIMERYNTIEPLIEDDMTDEDYIGIIEENLDYYVYEVDLNKIGNLSLDDLKNEAYEDWRGFVDKYCLKECVEE